MTTAPKSTATSFSLGRAMIWSALLVFLTTGFFMNDQPGWNVNSQLAMTYAVVERGTVRIDAYHDKPGLGTNDKAMVGGHFYTDKSPVTPLLGVPAFALYRWFSMLYPGSFNYDVARYWTTWLTIGTAAAILAALMTLLLGRLGVAPASAARASALWVAATPLLGYAILFFNYLPACAMALAGFILARRAWAGPTPKPPVLFFAGALIGLSVWTLNTLAILAIVLTAILILLPGSMAQRWQRVWPWAVGGIVGAAGHFIYMKAVFGTFGSPYAFEFDPEFREAMSKGLMGAGWPKPLVAWLITFSRFQGLFYWWPLALIALVGCAWMVIAGNRAERLDAIVALTFLVLLVLYTSGYYMWWGGRAYAPRHLIPVLALLGVGLVPLLRRRRLGYLVLCIGIIGALINFAPVARDPQPPVGLDQPSLMMPETVPYWPSPVLALERIVWQFGSVAPNWGTAIGLKGGLSILPLALIWVVFWTALFVATWGRYSDKRD